MSTIHDLPAMEHEETTGEGRPRTLQGGRWYWVHKALIRDHAPDIRAIGVAVYSCLASMADRSQECFPSQQYIADALGYSRATVSKTLKILERCGLIEVKKRDRCHCVYRLLAVSCQDNGAKMSIRGNRDVNQADTNKNKITRINNKITRINNNTVGSVNKLGFSLSKHNEGTAPKTREELLAMDLAGGLHDQHRLYRYLSLAHQYPEHLLRRLLSEVKQVPDIRIKKSRVALFNHLLKKYVQETNHDSGDQSRN